MTTPPAGSSVASKTDASQVGGTPASPYILGMPNPSDLIAARFVEAAGFLAINLASDHTGFEGAVQGVLLKYWQGKMATDDALELLVHV